MSKMQEIKNKVKFLDDLTVRLTQEDERYIDHSKYLLSCLEKCKAALENIEREFKSHEEKRKNYAFGSLDFELLSNYMQGVLPASLTARQTLAEVFGEGV